MLTRRFLFVILNYYDIYQQQMNLDCKAQQDVLEAV